MLTQRIKDKSVELLGYEMSQIELRLMPHIHYVMCNKQRFDYRHLNDDDLDVVEHWMDKGFLTESKDGRLTITKDFYQALNEFLWLGYIDIEK